MAAASATTAVVQGAAGIKGQKLRQGVRAGVARRARSVATSAKAVAEAGPVVRINQAEWNKLGQVCAVLGSQWGDEGKGKLVDILAQVR
jgi:adenylosuccinate synthase